MPAAPVPSLNSPPSGHPGDPTAARYLSGVDLDLAEAEKIAQRRHREGRHGAAAKLYGQILEAAPDHGEALLALGSYVLRAGHAAEARQLFEKAVALRPDHAPALAQLGAAHAMLGKLAEAEAMLLRAVALDPGHGDGHRNLGMVLHRLGRLGEAEAALREALRLVPARPKIERSLAAVLLDSGKLQEAADLYRRSLARQPQAPAGHLGLALALRSLGDRAGAMAALERAAALVPRNPRPRLEMGRLLLAEGEAESALGHFRAAAQLAPNDATIQTALAEALIAGQQIEEAAKVCDRAIAADPTDVRVMLVFASLLDVLDRSLDVVSVLRQAVERAPKSRPARQRLAEALLKSGDFAAGWPALEAAFGSSKRALPLWQGEAISGKRLLVDAGTEVEGILLLARLLPSVAAGGVQVHLRCPAEFRGLLGGMLGVASILVPGEVAPACDLGVSLTSLPRLLDLRIEAIPSTVGWLRSPGYRLAHWRQRLEEMPTPRVGLVWRSGSGEAPGNRRASLPAAALARLLSQSAASFVALNPGGSATEIAAAGLSHRLVDLGAEIPATETWAEIAAIVAGLDLVVSVDSPVAHLAGALGRPTLLMLAQPTSWWWFRERSDSPWYPTLRLIRQSAPGAWEGVVEEVAARLSSEVSS